MSSLKLSGINKIYPSGIAALYDINLETRDKEFLVIVGGEKSGKSSLLRVIAGLEDASSGIVAIDGKDVTETAPKDRNIAMVFKGDTLFQALSVYDNMAYGLKLRHAPQTLIDQRVKAVSNILGLNEVLYRKPKTLTAAAKQRVAIGRAIVREPRLYLFDEPLSGLDENLRADLLNLIINLQARMQGTFIYVTKNLSEAMTIGTRIAVLKEGLLQQADTPANLYDYPANTYVAFYIGSPTINFINGCTVVTEGDSVCLDAGFAKLPLPENILARFTCLDEYKDAGKKVIAGIRPEDAEIVENGLFKAVAGKSEESGGVTYTECKAGSESLVVRSAGAASGGEIQIAVDLSRLYIFDGQTRLTLLERDDGYAKNDFADSDFKPLPYDEEREVVEKLKPKKQEPKKKLR